MLRPRPVRDSSLVPSAKAATSCLWKSKRQTNFSVRRENFTSIDERRLWYSFPMVQILDGPRLWTRTKRWERRDNKNIDFSCQGSNCHVTDRGVLVMHHQDWNWIHFNLILSSTLKKCCCEVSKETAWTSRRLASPRLRRLRVFIFHLSRVVWSTSTVVLTKYKFCNLSKVYQTLRFWNFPKRASRQTIYVWWTTCLLLQNY